MPDSNVGALNHTLQLTQAWLKDLATRPPFGNEEQAYTGLRAVLHSLRDRLLVEEAVDLAAQLPTLVRGIYFEGWRPALAPNNEQTEQEFYDSVAESLRGARHSLDPAYCTRAVFDFLETRIDAGQLRHVLGQLPAPIKALWPHAARFERPPSGEHGRERPGMPGAL
jgi:uncharacterized protein (DUF2267 family)